MRLNLHLPKSGVDELTALRERCGAKSLASVVRDALRLYRAVVEGAAVGKDVYLIHRETQERDRLVL